MLIKGWRILDVKPQAHGAPSSSSEIINLDFAACKLTFITLLIEKLLNEKTLSNDRMPHDVKNDVKQNVHYI